METKLLLSSSLTNARGGGVGSGLSSELKGLGRVRTDKYFTQTCSLYGFNLILASPVNDFIGTRGLGKIKMMQLLYTAYAV